MHRSVLDFVRRVVTAGHVADRHVLEVGSYDVNGSVRPYVESLGPASYLGIDLRPGPGVDMVADICDPNLVADLGGFDVVLCLEALEHVRDYRRALVHMLELLAEGGLFVLTTRSPGFPRHDHPDDRWRFTREDLSPLCVVGIWLAIEDDPEHPGVFLALEQRGDPLFSAFAGMTAHPAPTS